MGRLAQYMGDSRQPGIPDSSPTPNTSLKGREPSGVAGISAREVSGKTQSPDKRTAVPLGPHSGAESDVGSVRNGYYYITYGLRVLSAFKLPELAAANMGPESASAQVYIHKGGVGPVSQEAVSIGPGQWACGSAVWLHYDATCRMLVRDGCEIVVEPSAHVDDRVIRQLVLGNGLAVILHQQGFLVLHGSAVAVDKSAVAFLGFSGAGKSTMTGALIDRGHAFVADDVVAVDMTDAARPIVFPAFPQLKLHPEAARALLRSASHSVPLHPDTPKLGRTVAAGFSQAPLPLGAVYVLEESSRSNEPEIERLKSAQAMFSLIRHSYAAGLLAAQGPSRRHFEQCASLVRHIPISRLKRALRLPELPGVARLVEQDCPRAA
jgi:hypothetical protein